LRRSSGRTSTGIHEERVRQVLFCQESMLSQLRVFVYSCTARDILETPDVGRVSLEHFVNTVSALRFEVPLGAQASPAAPYLEQMRSQMEELARRIPSTGRGSIPHSVQCQVWRWIEARVLQACTEVVGRLGKRKSQDGFSLLAEDFRALQTALQASALVCTQESEAMKEEFAEGLWLSSVASARSSWSYLHLYLDAHNLSPSDAPCWCRGHPEYPVRLQVALITFLQTSQKLQRQQVSDLEAYAAAWINDEVQRQQAQDEISDERLDDGPVRL